MARKPRRSPSRLSKWQKAELYRRQRERADEVFSSYETRSEPVTAPDGEWQIRNIRPGHSEKEYTCPGCHRPIPVGQAHIVAWRDDHIFGETYGAAERRHWHSKCWNSRHYRYR